MMNQGFISQIRIAAWNINGFSKRINNVKYNKLEDENVLKTVQDFDIFCLLETHHTAEQVGSLHIDQFKNHSICRPKPKNARRYKPSGGLSLYIRKTMVAGVVILPEPGTESIFIKLRKQFFGLENHVIVCFSYCVPTSSAVLNRDFMPEDLFEDLGSKLSKYERQGDLILMGDLNSRTGSILDYIANESNDYMPVPNIYTDTEYTFARNSQDNKVNSYGRKLIELCKTLPLRILNGRKLGDLLGNFTCQNSRGRSVVDYCAASPGLMKQIPFFSVGHILPVHSDHCPIDITLKVNAAVAPEGAQYQYVDKPDNIRWLQNRKEAFCNAVQSPACKQAVAGFLNVGILPDQASVEGATAFLTNLLKTSAQIAGMDMRRGAKARRQARPDQARKRRPKWHDISCQEAYKKVQLSSKLVSKFPNCQYLRGKLFAESKEYKRIVKQKQKEFLSGIFEQLDAAYLNNPRKYMDIVRSLKKGSFDKKISSDTEAIEPQEWFNHFQQLLGEVKPASEQEVDMKRYIETHRDSLRSELDCRISRSELLQSAKKLKNNKATAFDCVSNEMLKNSALVLCEPFLLLFNTILENNLYPSAWKDDILCPLFKSGVKSDCNNFRGICISSCFGKWFKSILRNRLEEKCRRESLIPPEQCSGKVKARTADHLLVFQHIVRKYVQQQNRSVYVCFFDLAKAFDSISRVRLFYDLLVHYKVGGKYLKILQGMYTENRMHIRLDDGLSQPFVTTTGVFQGCNMSPLLFNLYTSQLPKVYDDMCDPVFVNNKPVHVLAWADDTVVFSLSEAGLRRSIDKTVSYYQDLGLSVNVKKTKVMVFNKRGLGPRYFSQLKFFAGGLQLEIAEQYTYLGVVFIPSGAVYEATNTLATKCSRAWFSLSNFLYENKRMSVEKYQKLIDTLVLPVGLYSSELLAPLSLPAKSFLSTDNLLQAWEGFYLEIVNQRACRLLLSVQKKTSRLAVLGELGRYPVFIKSIVQSIMYEHCILKYQPKALVGQAIAEMQVLNDSNSWQGRVRSMKTLLEISEYPENWSEKRVSKNITNKIQSKFEIFFKDEINKEKVGAGDGTDHNKLRFYKTFKGCFKPEYYISNINNRNQRAWLSRLRTSSHRLEVERGRYTGVPFNQRLCKYCPQEASGMVDTETHYLLECAAFSNQRRCFLARIASLVPNFGNLSKEDKVKILLCPASNIAAKTVNKFIGLMFKAREKIDEGADPAQLTFPPQVILQDIDESDADSDVEGEYDSASGSEE